MKKSEVCDQLLEATKKPYERHLAAVPRPLFTHEEFNSLFVPEHLWGPFRIASEHAVFGHPGVMSTTINGRRVGLLLQKTHADDVIPLAPRGSLEIRNHGTPLHQAFVQHVEELTDVAIGWARVRALITRLLGDGWGSTKTYTVRAAVYLLPGLKALANDDIIDLMEPLKTLRPSVEFALRGPISKAAQTITLSQILPEEIPSRSPLPFEVRIISHTLKEDGLELTVSPP